DVEVAFERNDARHAEHDDARSLGGDGRAEAALATIVEVGDGYYLATTSAGGKDPPTPRSRKGGNALRWPRRERRPLPRLGLLRVGRPRAIEHGNEQNGSNQPTTRDRRTHG